MFVHPISQHGNTTTMCVQTSLLSHRRRWTWVVVLSSLWSSCTRNFFPASNPSTGPGWPSRPGLKFCFPLFRICLESILDTCQPVPYEGASHRDCRVTGTTTWFGGMEGGMKRWLRTTTGGAAGEYDGTGGILPEKVRQPRRDSRQEKS